MKKVLIIDDDSRMLKLLAGYLEGAYETVLIKSGALALTYLKENVPDAIVLDYMMPALDGPHTLAMIREDERLKKVPAIFLTSVTDKKRIHEMEDTKPDGYLVKPVAQEELLIALSKLI